MNNVGAGYGDDVATAPMLLVAPLADEKEFAASLSTTAAETAATVISRLASASWNRKRMYVPGQEALDAQLLLLDGLGQVINNAKSLVGSHISKNQSKAECAGTLEILSKMFLRQVIRGSPAAPMTAVVQSLLCTPAQPCVPLFGPIFHSFDSNSGVCDTLAGGGASAQPIMCSSGGDAATVQLSLVGAASSGLEILLPVTCNPCKVLSPLS